MLFGKINKRINYNSKKVKVFPVFQNVLKNWLYGFIRTGMLLVKYPKRFVVLINRLRAVKGVFNKCNWWPRYVIVLLYLPDVFHLQWAKDIENWFFLKEELDVKFVVSLRGAHINYSPIIKPDLAETYKVFFPKVDRFHGVSKAIALEAQKYGANKNRINVIPSIISNETINLFRLPKPFKNNKLRLVSAGRYHWKKGYSIALDACKILKDQGLSFLYTIIASGEVPEELLFQRRQLDLENEVEFMKALPQKELFMKMQDSDVLLLPSLEEGIANVVLEAMALGVPIISSNCGGMSEVILDNVTGWLFPILDQNALARAIKSLYEISEEKKINVVYNAYTFLNTYFNEKESTEKFDDFYKKLVRD